MICHVWSPISNWNAVLWSTPLSWRCFPMGEYKTWTPSIEQVHGTGPSECRPDPWTSFMHWVHGPCIFTTPCKRRPLVCLIAGSCVHVTLPMLSANIILWVSLQVFLSHRFLMLFILLYMYMNTKEMKLQSNFMKGCQKSKLKCYCFLIYLFHFISFLLFTISILGVVKNRGSMYPVYSLMDLVHGPCSWAWFMGLVHGEGPRTWDACFVLSP